VETRNASAHIKRESLDKKKNIPNKAGKSLIFALAHSQQETTS
jgi:hypothetical protein